MTEPVFVLPLRRAGGSPPACGPACAAKESLEEAAVLVVLYVAAVIIDIRVLVALQIGLVFLGLAAGHGLDLLDLGDQLFAGQLGIKGLSSKSSMSSIRSASSALVGPASCAMMRYLPNGLALSYACLWAA